jgi:hypothetical protein
LKIMQVEGAELHERSEPKRAALIRRASLEEPDIKERTPWLAR